MKRGTKTLILRLGVLALSTGIALAAAEVVVRRLDVGPHFSPVFANALRLSDNPRLIYELVPDSVADTRWGATTNSDGMRDREYSISKSSDTVRIAMIGDSITLGWEVEQDRIFPAIMEQSFENLPGPPIEVLNFGVVGYNVSQILETLRARALKYEPDIVVYSYCLNDPLDYSFMEERLRAKLTPAENQLWETLHSTTRRGLARSRLFMLTRYLLRSRSDDGGQTIDEPDPMKDPAFAAVGSEGYATYFRGLHEGENWLRVERALDELAELSREHGFVPYIAIFPLLRDLGDYRLSGVHQKITDAARSRSIEVVDLLGPFQRLQSGYPNEADISVDPVHPKAVGHHLAAKEIAAALVADGAVPR